jgi:hypothetical protein
MSASVRFGQTDAAIRWSSAPESFVGSDQPRLDAPAWGEKVINIVQTPPRRES